MLHKTKNFLLNNLQIILTILGCTLAVCVVYKLQDLAPFGKSSMLTIDFFHQYGPMLGELYDRIQNGSNLIYSFNMAMGLPFFRNFFNYLSSPFNIVMFLFEHKDIVMSYSVIIGLKVIASSVTMLIYLKNKFNTKSLMLVPLSLLYAFSAYFVAYYWNIMWLDGLVFLPLVTLGIEALVDNNKYKLYVISLAIILFANYFIAYMICIFSVLYFITYMIISTKKFNIKEIIKKCLKFALYSLLAGGLVAVFLIPMYFALKGISATSDTFPDSQYYVFTIKDFLLNHFSGIGSTVLNSGTSKSPNISVGILPVALFFLFIINPKIKLKTKIPLICLLSFIAYSFFSGPIDFIWHAFHVPNDLPFRYSFIYSFVLIIISAYSIMNIKYLKPKYVGIVYLFTLLCISSLIIFKYNNINKDMIILNFIIITIAYLCYIMYAYFNYFKKLIGPIMIITAILEVTIITNNNWAILQYISNFYQDYDFTQNALNYIKDNDNEMFRIEKEEMLTFNDASWYNYYGQTTFSSMEYENMAVLQHKLGLPGNEINSYYYKNTTPVYDLMFNLKYFIGTRMDINRYSEYYNKNNIVVNKNNYNIGLMYAVNKDIKMWKYNLNNPLAIQNDYLKKTTGIEDVFTKMKMTSEVFYNKDNKVIIKYTVKNPKENMYFYYNSSNIDFMIIDGSLYYNNLDYTYTNDLLGDLDIFHYMDYNEKYIINTRTDDNTYSFYVGYNNYYSDNIYAYTINNEKFIKAYEILNNSKVNITDFNENNINCNINLKTDKTIYTSIPFDEGWEVYADGKKIKTNEIGNALLSFDLPKGNHKITLNYHIPKIKISLAISLISLIIFIGLTSIKKVHKSK